LYVGNLSYNVQDSDLEALFTHYGPVQSAQVIMDRDTGRSKGFAFVEMCTEQEAHNAIAALSRREMDSLASKADETRSQGEGRGGDRGAMTSKQRGRS